MPAGALVFAAHALQVHSEGSAVSAFRLRLFNYAFAKFILIGISSHVLPSSVRPARFFCMRPIA